MPLEPPAKIKPRSLADYLEVMSKAIFQTGISWRVVEAKWPGTKQAFFDFDPLVISGLNAAEIDHLAVDTRLIRNRRKIEAVVENARRLLELDRRQGGFRAYLRSFASYDELAADLRRQFKFLGEMGIYYFLWVVSEKVPSYEEWSAKHNIRRPA
jgi:3-methyladenine DNA glycosylase Tag